MTVNISIYGATMEDALKLLSTYGSRLEGFTVSADAAITDSAYDETKADVPPAPQMRPKQAQTKPAEAPVPTDGEIPVPVEAAPKAAAKPANQEAPAPAKEDANQEPAAPTKQQLQALGRQLAFTGKQDVLTSTLKQYGAGKISELPVDKYAEIYAAWEAANV